MTRVQIISSLPTSSGSGEALEWRFSPDLESEITTLAALCQAKQQQREPIVPLETDDEDDVDDSTGEAEHTSLLSSMSLFDDVEMRKVFLDRLAELLCHQKDPKLISSTAMIYNDEATTIIAARNSSPGGDTWSKKDIKMLEDLSEVLESVSSDVAFKPHPIPPLQRILVNYYVDRMRYHARNIVEIEGGKTELKFFKEDGCGGFLSNRLSAYQFAQRVKALSGRTDFYAILKDKLTTAKLRRVVRELDFVERPLQGALDLSLTAQQCSGFRKIKVLLVNNHSAKRVNRWQLPKANFPMTSQVETKFHNEAKKKKHVHAEMMLTFYLLGQRALGSEVFPYLGISKKTCFLCGHMLNELGRFKTRGNHGKCCSQWTLPSGIRTEPESTERLNGAAQRLRDTLQGEAAKEVIHRDAEKESTLAAHIPPRYEMKRTVFNDVVKDSRFLSRRAEWISGFRREVSGEDVGPVSSDTEQHDAAASKDATTEDPKTAESRYCRLCKKHGELAYTCNKCGSVAYCDSDCFRADWYRHKFSCNLGRPLDATDYLIFSCHENQFPYAEDVAKEYGFSCFASGRDRSWLFQVYRRLVIEWAVDEDELRAALKQDKLKEMLISRCQQTGDAFMLCAKQWLERQGGFRANGKGSSSSLVVAIKAASEELLSSDERKLPFMELQPPEKRRALLFYYQIRLGFKPDVAEDNWLLLGLCTAPDTASENRLVLAYASLIQRCTFKEFWTAMAKSGMVKLFGKYGLANTISDMRNFEHFMATVQKRYESVWELKRFTRMHADDPFQAVVVDYGFMNCENPLQRMALRRMYEEYFNRGEDEMKLHEACVAGRLADFLRSVAGDLSVPSYLLQNLYPLANFPLAGMVTDFVTMCPESVLEQVVAAHEDGDADGDESMIITIPDAENEAVVRLLHDRAAFLGTELRTRYHAGSNGKTVMTLMMQ